MKRFYIKTERNLFMRRDQAYINYMNSINDPFWSGHEKWLYYDEKNKDLIIPTAVSCFIVFFLDNPVITIFWDVLIILFALFICKLNNKKLDNDPRILANREFCKHLRKKEVMERMNIHNLTSI